MPAPPDEYAVLDTGGVSEDAVDVAARAAEAERLRELREFGHRMGVAVQPKDERVVCADCGQAPGMTMCRTCVLREPWRYVAARAGQAEKDATERAAKIAERFAHGIVDRGDMECCGSNEQAWLIERSREIAAAIRESPRPAPALCGVVGHPGSGRMVCEREPHEAGTYHQQGAVRWLGYERPAPEPDPKEGE
jgi:hypothetical protein